ncbi:RND efflux pump membrane fusion protein barrel-sandwich domain-containing protein [Candidatus Electronema halotolerans]
MKKISAAVLLVRVVLCLLILAAGVAGMKRLNAMKKPPVQVEQQERALPVQVLRAQTESVPVIISGYGEVAARSVITLPAEVSGRITTAYKNLHVGAVIQQGEVLYMINDQDYRLELDSAQARLKSLARDLELTRKEQARLSGLYQKNIGSQSNVEQAERAVNAIQTQIIQLEQAQKQAKLHLARCLIRAPFTGRITELFAEQDEYVTPGKNLVTLTNDSDLEAQVPLDSREALKWLRFQQSQDGSWFGRPEKTACTVTWTENAAVQAEGSVDRAVRFDAKTRSVVLAIRIKPKKGAAIPLTQGMFCRVDIQGHAIKRAVVLPRQAVSFENTVYVVKENRLQTRPVEVARVQNGKAIVVSGLQEGEQVIVTRLENPPENSLVQIQNRDAGFK